MPNLTPKTISAFPLAATTLGIGVLLLAVTSASADPPTTIELNGIIRDFQSTHADFKVVPPTGPGHYTGSVLAAIGGDERPVFQAGGSKVATEWRDSANRQIAPHMFGVSTGCLAVVDQMGASGPAGSGAIASAATFDEWFRDVAGTNLSITHAISLIRNGSGVYEYLDDGFDPINGQLFGNEGDPYNHYFTYALEAEFEYTDCGSQFIEFEGGDGVWIFVNDQLVVDLGGMIAVGTQIIELDRLGLTGGDEYKVHIFYAQRQPFQRRFRLRTNIELSTDGVIPAVTAAYD